MQNKILIGLLIVSLLGNVLLAWFLFTHTIIDYKAKYALLRTSYVSLANAQKYLFEILLKNQADLKRLLPEYKDMTREEFEEAMRRKIIKLEMEIRDLERNQ